MDEKVPWASVKENFAKSFADLPNINEKTKVINKLFPGEVMSGFVTMGGVFGLLLVGAEAMHQKEFTFVTGSLMGGAAMMVFLGLIFNAISQGPKTKLIGDLLSNK